MENAVAHITALDKGLLQYATFGHLYPKHNVEYKCKIVFSYTEWGEVVLISFLANKDLDMSPILYEHVNQLVDSLVWNEDKTVKIEEGIYIFTGTYKLKKSGGHRFAGKVDEYAPLPKRIE